MKLMSFRFDGSVRHGVVENDEVHELGDGDLQLLIERSFPLRHADLGEPRAVRRLSDVSLCAPLLRPGKLLAAAANYQDHVTETGGDPLDKTNLSPRLFLKPPTCIVGPGEPLDLPEMSKQVDWEAELGVVIGARAKDVRVESALDYVAGYLSANDVSARTIDHAFTPNYADKAVWFFDWLAGKWFDGFAPMGPYLVTADEVPDPQDLSVRFELNGLSRQNGSTKDMIFSVAELIAHASRLMTLEPGDIILTGTPSGVGAATGEFVSSGDTMAVTIGNLGTLVTPVR